MIGDQWSVDGVRGSRVECPYRMLPYPTGMLRYRVLRYPYRMVRYRYPYKMLRYRVSKETRRHGDAETRARETAFHITHNT